MQTTPTQADFTLAEAQKALAAFTASIGRKASVFPTLNEVDTQRGFLLHVSIYPKGIVQRERLEARADTWRELLAACEAAWAEHSDLHATNTIREMALEIITITADQGQCTDAALRAKFDAADVTRYGERACEQATELASNGPFSIVTLAGANAEAA